MLGTEAIITKHGQLLLDAMGFQTTGIFQLDHTKVKYRMNKQSSEGIY